LIEHGCKVSIAGDGRSLNMLKLEFPELDHYKISSFSPIYSSNRFLIATLLLQLPSMVISIFKEYLSLMKLLKNHDFDIVISDNRYGFWNNKRKSILITHQLMLKMPKGFGWSEWFVHKLLSLLFIPFNSIWIPDFEMEPTLSSDLSHKYTLPKKALFIGPLSRFAKDHMPSHDKTIDVLALISGAEPQRSIFEEKLVKQFAQLKLNSVLVAGKPEKKTVNQKTGNTEFIPFLSGGELANLINKSKVIVCRSGYSSIMDMSVLEAKVIFVPTPGQTEQEYLATKLSNDYEIVVSSQNDLNIGFHFEEACKRKGFISLPADTCLELVIARLIENSKE
jgi:uncharacterized protein (TIGR00661 family)